MIGGFDIPAYEFAFPKDAYNVKIRKRDSLVEYPIDIDAMGFTRTGEDGAVYCLPLFGGDEFIGEVLEGHWKKGWTTGMDADQAFTAILDGSGACEFEGEADVAGTWGYGKITSSHVLPMLDEVELQVSMQVPIDDTGAVADRDIIFWFILDKLPTVTVTGADNSLRFNINVDEDGLELVITKEIGTVATILAYGYDYTMDSTRTTEAVALKGLRGVIWRITFHDGHYGTAAPNNAKHIHVYLKQSTTIAAAESATEYQVTGSPFNISDILFEAGYPIFQIGSQNTTYFDSTVEAKSTYVKVDYPDIEPIYEVAPSDQLLSEVELWDGDPDSGGVKVYDKDHTFSNAVYLQNGLIQAQFPNALGGLIVYGYFSAAWNQLNSEFFPVLNDDNEDLEYVSVQSIQSISPEKVEVVVRFKDDATEDTNYYMDAVVTLKRGQFLVTISPTLVYPIQTDFDWEMDKLTNDRFNYVGDGGVGDDDLGEGYTNTTMSDNYGITFDNIGDAVLVFWGTNKTPDTSRRVSTAGWQVLNNILNADILDLKFYVGYIPFSLVANLFEEAEDADLNGTAATVTDALASPLLGANNAVELPAQNDNVQYNMTAGTELEAGRYLAVVRAKRLNDVANDLGIRVFNVTDSSYMNEENYWQFNTITDAFLYYTTVFDISQADVDDGDSFHIRVMKLQAGANTLTIDYFVIVPIGDGESFPQDLAHNALRGFNKARRVVKK